MPHKTIKAWALAGLAALTLVSCSSEPKQETIQNSPLPAGVHQGTLKEAIDELDVANEGSRSGYSREKFGYPIKGSDGCNTRKRILIAEAVTEPKVIQPGCKLEGGKWTSYLDGKILTNAQSVTIDHTVPLAEAWRSGALTWADSNRSRFANEVNYAPTLAGVTSEVNSDKGDKDPASWMPPNKEATCMYLGSWVSVKLRWGLSVDPGEKSALLSHESCMKYEIPWIPLKR